MFSNQYDQNYDTTVVAVVGDHSTKDVVIYFKRQKKKSYSNSHRWVCKLAFKFKLIIDYLRRTSSLCRASGGSVAIGADPTGTATGTPSAYCGWCCASKAANRRAAIASLSRLAPADAVVTEVAVVVVADPPPKNEEIPPPPLLELLVVPLLESLCPEPGNYNIEYRELYFVRVPDILNCC
jgi:hypothetical protein